LLGKKAYRANILILRAPLVWLVHYPGVLRAAQLIDHRTAFLAELVRPLWTARLVDGPNLDSLRTTKAGLTALSSI
jgi:hypothetical protein